MFYKGDVKFAQIILALSEQETRNIGNDWNYSVDKDQKATPKEK